MPRIAVGGLHTECSTYNPVLMHEADFRVLRGAALPAHAHTAGLRTEHLQIEADPAGEGRIARVEHLGDQSHLHITLGAHRLVTLADPHTPLQAGQPVRLTAERPLLFDAAGVRIAA